MGSGASLGNRNPCLLASPRVKVGPGTVRFPGFERGMRGALSVAAGSSGRWSVSVESKLSCEPGEGGVGAIGCGDRWRMNALERIDGFGDFGVTTVAVRAFKKKFPSIGDFLDKDHKDKDDEEEDSQHRGSKVSNDDDTTDTTTTTTTDEEDTSTTDEEDTTEDDDEDDEEDEGECDD